MLHSRIGALVFLLNGWLAAAQNNHGPVRIAKTGDDLRVAWTGIGTLQSSPTPAGDWQDVLGAGNPFVTPPVHTQLFFRVVSRWDTRANLIAANSEMGVAELDGKIYVLGGYPASRVTVNTVQVYNSASNTWRLTAPLLMGVNHSMPATAAGKLYVIGGQTDTGSAYVSTVQEFDPQSGQWTSGAPMPTTRGGVNGIAANGYFFVFGGEGPNGVFDEMEMYVPAQNRWYQLEPLPIPVHGVTGSAFLHGRIHLPGGGTATGGSSGEALHQVFSVDGIKP